MNRLARLMPFRHFGRLRHLRGLVPCPPLDSLEPAGASGFSAPGATVNAQLAAMPAFARVSLNSAVHAEPSRRAPVRVYHGPSRVILVGSIDAVCRMIDRCIDEERAGLRAAQLG
ncbi:hypothetical protein WKR88_06365 [Trinickia caryophylli]|uniref:Uncharacterized protein n=1 Tax=Trinickia caryophylli TaxID=28094 RepID=A0A1X7FWA9_TRICW|nr:hypothetical protein [Trinickia caryophylli]PMS11788.1 hypothetical protein C0Z17_13260 [Trinickia caryophylli]TRX17468.1 hypothetical protein FNF07_03940 [Trinickia caryophylli]WQE11788.1 hypothetical protein U0034_18965 [Trinickia caryophylli]SMF59801.1 hypothetical protein SAMN06295900_11242 [Trinickia caryophylli]GLU34712.1 hypothetical protein Busp01_45540 [Trinickia caryophylli]